MLENGMIANIFSETLSWLLVLYRNNLDGSLRAILNPCEFQAKLVTKLTAAYRLETKEHFSIDGMVFFSDGTQPKNSVMKIIRSRMNITEKTWQPLCCGGQLYKLSQPVRCYIQDRELRTAYIHGKNNWKTQVLYCINMRQHLTTYLK